MVCPTSLKCFAVGGSADGNGGTILASKDGGVTWAEQTPSPFPYVSVYDPQGIETSGLALYGTAAVPAKCGTGAGIAASGPVCCSGASFTLTNGGGTVLAAQPFALSPAQCYELGTAPSASYFPVLPNVLTIGCDGAGVRCFAATATGSYGKSGATPPVLMVTGNSGATWQYRPFNVTGGSVPTSDIWDISVVGGSTVAMVTMNYVLVSSNGGATFTAVQPLSNPAAYNYGGSYINFVAMATKTQGFLGGSNDYGYNWFMQTSNGGLSWTDVTDPNYGLGSSLGWRTNGANGGAPFDVYGVAFDNVNTAYAYSFDASNFNATGGALGAATVAYTTTASIGQNGAGGSTPANVWTYLWTQDSAGAFHSTAPGQVTTQQKAVRAAGLLPACLPTHASCGPGPWPAAC